MFDKILVYLIVVLILIVQIARDFLSIPATSSPSERVFKAADDHITHDRNRLKPENASKLIFMQQALKNLDMPLYDLCFHSNYGATDVSEDERGDPETPETEIDVVESDAATEGDENDASLDAIQSIDDDLSIPNIPIDIDINDTIPE